MFTYWKCSLIHESQVIFFSGIFAFCYHNGITDSSFSGRLLCYQIITWNIKSNYELLNFKVREYTTAKFSADKRYFKLPIMPWAASSISSALYNNWTPPLGYFAKCPFPLPPASTYNHVICRYFNFKLTWISNYFVISFPAYLIRYWTYLSFDY